MPARYKIVRAQGVCVESGFELECTEARSPTGIEQERDQRRQSIRAVESVLAKASFTKKGEQLRRECLHAVPPWALFTIPRAIDATAAHTKARTTLPSDIRQQGEQLERLQREREDAQRNRVQPAPQAPPSPTTEAPKPWPVLDSPCLPIHEIAQGGDSSESFQWVLDFLISGSNSAIGRCLEVSGFNAAAERVQQALISRGFATSRIVFEAQYLRTYLGWALGDSGQEAYLGLDHGSLIGPNTLCLVGRYLAGAVFGVRGNVKQLRHHVFIGKPISRPEYFRTATATAKAGFSLSFLSDRKNFVHNRTFRK